MQALILVGGFATRLRPLTDTRPKALLPILNKPMIMHLIDKVRGIVDEVILAVNYGKEYLSEYFEEHECEIPIILHPETEPLGTGGAIKNAEKLIDDTFIVFNGDVVTSLDIHNFIEFHKQNNGLGVLALWEVSDPTRFGIISIDENNRITKFLEKPKPEEIFSHLINAGTYCLEPEILDLIPGGRKVSIEREVFPVVLDRGLYGLEFKGYWFDAGTPEIYITTQKTMLDIYLNEGVIKNNIGERTKLSPTAKVDQKVLIGTDCTIEDNSVVGPYVFIGDGVTIGSGCRILNSVIDEGTKVGKGVTGKNFILGRNNEVALNLELPDGLVTGDEYKIDEKYLAEH